jgi:hypothetical protein
MALFTVDELRELFNYDAQTGLFYLKQSKKHGFNPNKPVGFLLRHGYIGIHANGKKMHAHRAAWAFYYGEMPVGYLDHIDRNVANNRISNLRLATPLENSLNAGGYGSVPAKGVYRHKRSGKYYAKIRIQGRQTHLGVFETVDEAAHAYNKAAIQFHGEFACINPIGTDK